MRPPSVVQYGIVLPFESERGGIAVSGINLIVAFQGKKFVDEGVFEVLETSRREIRPAVRQLKQRIPRKNAVLRHITHSPRGVSGGVDDLDGYPRLPKP